MRLNVDCRYYLGGRPCKPHKQTGVHCQDCKYYDPIAERILIIKLGAAGDVIRTTPLLRKLRVEMSKAYITWVTDYAELLPSQVDQKIKVNERTLQWLKAMNFDIIFSLDKEPIAVALAELTRAPKKFGFGMDKYGHCRPFNHLAEHKLVTGLWDDIGKANTKSYQEEIFEMCGYTFAGERYILEKTAQREWNLQQPSPLVGLNTGCGLRWPSRLWPDEHWTVLAQKLKGEGIGTVWLGGPQEHEKNERLAKLGGGCYPGYFPIAEFIDLVDQCDVVVTQVTMALHIVIALRKRIVLMDNIFNSNEFELYGLGEILQPQEPCGCFYARVCPHDSMKKITPSVVIEAVLRQLHR